MIKNKNFLTLNDIKMTNQLTEVIPVVIFSTILFCSLIFVPFITIVCIKEKIDILDFLLSLFVILFSLRKLIILRKRILKKNEEKTYIEKSNFKIVEDEIYDKCSKKLDNYYIFSKIYGKISVDIDIYNKANKGDSIYLLFYNGNEKIENYNPNIDEYKRNLEIINKKYLASKCYITPELKYNFIPYNESLGEKIYRNRIQDSNNL